MEVTHAATPSVEKAPLHTGQGSPRARVSVVVPAHNAGAVLGNQLAALADQQGAPPFEVIVVLNRCSDDTCSVTELFQDRLKLRVVPAEERASAAYARNVGARHATGEVVLFCDADDRVGPVWVARLAATVLDEGADYAGGAVVVDRTRLPVWAYDAFYSGLDDLYRKAPVDGVERPVGGSLAVRAAALRAVGGFDEQLRTTEDSDLTVRLLRSGYRLGIAPDALLTVRPRATLRSLLHQQRTWALGTAQLQGKERRLPPPDSWLREHWKLGKWVAHQVVKQRRMNPIEVLVLASTRMANQRARRVQWHHMVAQGIVPDAWIGESEFLAPPEASLIGGLGFRVAERDLSYWTGGGFAADALRAVGAVLRSGDIVVDAPAGVGIHAVHAARCVGPGGQVFVIEEDTGQQERLRENLRRHGEESTVTSLTSYTALLEALQGIPSHHPDLADRHERQTVDLVSVSVSHAHGRLLETLERLVVDHPECIVHLRFGEPPGSADSSDSAMRLLNVAQNRVVYRWDQGRLTSGDHTTGAFTEEDLRSFSASAGSILLVPPGRSSLVTAPLDSDR